MLPWGWEVGVFSYFHPLYCLFRAFFGVLQWLVDGVAGEGQRVEGGVGFLQWLVKFVGGGPIPPPPFV